VAIAPSEGATGAAGGEYLGGRLGYAAGPFNVALALGQQGYANFGNIKYNTLNIAGSWKVGAATLMIQYNDEKLDADPARTQGTAPVVSVPQELAEERWLFGGSFVMGQGLINISYVMSDWKNNNPTTAANEADADADQFAIGYVYNLSPRTALYATYSKISNDGLSVFSVAGGGNQNGAPTAGGSSTGMEFGLRHSF
jgi:predicted porin